MTSITSHINITIINKLPVVVGDKTKLQQLFQNLISNAIKFNDKEKGLIEIDVEEQSKTVDDDEQSSISASDNEASKDTR